MGGQKRERQENYELDKARKAGWGGVGQGPVGSTVPAGRASGARVGGPGVSSAGETEKREKHRGGPGGGRRGKSSAHSKLPPRERVDQP